MHGLLSALYCRRLQVKVSQAEPPAIGAQIFLCASMAYPDLTAKGHFHGL